MNFLVGFFLPAILLAGQVTNMTEYWAKQLNYSKLTYEAFAGYQPLDWYFSDAQIFYTYWGVDSNDMNSSSVPLIIFLQGGPGAASQFSAFNYIGPVKVVGKDEDMHVEANTNGWNMFGNLLVVDQPIGVGFSYSSNNYITKTSEQAAMYFSNFLYNFMKTWNCSAKEVYITGESYAGHYVPVFSENLIKNTSFPVNLKGISIGGAYIDSYIQDNFFDSFLESFGIIDEQVGRLLQYHSTQSMINIRKGRYAEAAHELNRISNDEDFFDYYYGGINIFNVRNYSQGNTNYDYDDYLTSIRDAFKIVPNNLTYIDENDQIYEAFSADLAMSKEKSLIFCLQNNIRVNLYVGQNDAVVSSPGLQTFLNSWGWSNKEKWQLSDKQIIKFGENVYGWRKSYLKFQFVVFNDAGHFVPADQPIAFNDVFGTWIDPNRVQAKTI